MLFVINFKRCPCNIGFLGMPRPIWWSLAAYHTAQSVPLMVAEHSSSVLFRPNRVMANAMARPVQRNYHRCSFNRVGYTRAIHCWRSFRTVRTGLLCRHSTRCRLLCHDLDSGAEFFWWRFGLLSKFFDLLLQLKYRNARKINDSASTDFHLFEHL